MDYFSKIDGANGYARASLLSLGQGLSSLHDPLRLHPALHPQVSSDGGKGGSSPLLRPLSDYAPLPLLPFGAPPFLPPHLDPRLPFSPSAFHPLHAPTGATPGSAFSPLTSKPDAVVSTSVTGIPTCGIFSHGGLLDPRNPFLGGLSPPRGSISALDDRRDSPSPRGSSHGSRDSPGHTPREADSPGSPPVDEVRGRKPRPGEFWCPVCGVTLRLSELESHLSLEVEKLTRITQSRQRTTPTPNSSPSMLVVGLSNSSPLSPSILSNSHRPRDPGWETYQRVRANRQIRLKTKKRRSGKAEEACCPFCSERVPASSAEEYHLHVDHCIRRNGEDEVVDVEGDVSTEEADWCIGQRRPERPGHPIFPSQPPPNAGAKREEETNGEKENNNEGGNRAHEEAMEKELEELKEKVKSLQRENTNSPKYLCLACQNEYERPAVSLACWHVMCEACWIPSIGTKGECPQCSQSVTRDDLRPIYL